MLNVNKVIIGGTLGRDPEMRYLANGDSSCAVAVKTTSRWKDRVTGEEKELVEWHRVVLYRQLADFAVEKALKGAQVYVEGFLQTRKWTDGDNIERFATEIIADVFQIVA